MGNISTASILKNDSTLPGRQLRWLVYSGNGIYLASLILTLSAVLWNTPRPWGQREGVLVLLVSLQVALCGIFFVMTLYPRWPLIWPWLTGYFLLSFGLWLIEWRLAASFWWIIWIQVFQLYISLPLKVAIPVTGLIFLMVTHLDTGLKQFFDLPLAEIVDTLIRWVIFSKLCAFVALLTRSNQERARLITELQAAQQKIELAHQQELELATLRERERLARDMHDSLGHALVTLSVQLEAMQRLYRVNPEGTLKQIDALKSLTRTSMEALRRTLAGLRTPDLENRPLTQALRDLSREISQRTGIEIVCQAAAEVDQLSPMVIEALWRVIQEALMNVEKHAAARHVQIGLHLRPEAVTLRVTDDGIGLPPGSGSRPGHYGLRGMRERMEGLGGTLILSRNGRGGTVLEACLPLIGNNEPTQEEQSIYEDDTDIVGRRSNPDAARVENNP